MNHEKGSVFGSLLLIVGCCIGGGMLGVPVISTIAGFKPSVVTFFITWLFMCTTALLVLEVNLWYPAGISLITMAGETLGKAGQVVTWGCFLFLFYALSIAYLAASGDLVSAFAGMYLGWHIEPWLGSCITCVVFGAFLYLGTRSVDLFNRLLMAGLTISYVLLVALGAPHVKEENLQYQNWLMAPWLLPVMIISFGFHNMIPSLRTYLASDVKRIRTAVILGSIAPLIIYLIWEWVIMGLLPTTAYTGIAEVLDKGQMATDVLKSAVGTLWVVDVTHYFAFFAILTSFLANSLSFIDFFADGLKVKKTPIGKIFLCLLVIGPPLVMALVYPNAFLSALNYAGGFGAVLLFGILPALMVWSGRYVQGIVGPYRVFGGRVTLVIVMLFSLIIVGMQLLLDKGG